MSAITTRAPSATNSRAISAPWPWAPPVTTATLPASRLMLVLLRGSDAQLHHRIGGEAEARVTALEEAAHLGLQVLVRPDESGLVEALLDDRSRDQRDHAAVHDEDLAGDVAGGRRGQVGDQGRHMLG